MWWVRVAKGGPICVKSGDVGPLQSPGGQAHAAITDRKHVSSRAATRERGCTA